MSTWKGIVGRSFKPNEFDDYVRELVMSDWKPTFIVLHNTSEPRLSQWHSTPGDQRMRNLEEYYRNPDPKTGKPAWSAGPHLFIADDVIWVFTPLTTSGIHSPSWNSTSWGVEMVGEFDEEPFDERVRDNTISALASLHAKLGLDPSGLRLHKEDPKTSHRDCPGKNVSKSDVIERVIKRIPALHAGEHLPIKDVDVKVAIGEVVLQSSELNNDTALVAVAAGQKKLQRIPGSNAVTEGAGSLQDALNALAAFDTSLVHINLGDGNKNRGIYGPLTEEAVRRFQELKALPITGIVDAATLATIDLTLVARRGKKSGGIAVPPGIDQIIQIAAGSDISHYQWENRGVAPIGYIKGMAIVYASVHSKLAAGDPVAIEMAKANTGNGTRDALAWYSEKFHNAGMSIDTSGPDTLRHLFVLLVGLGMRESSGRYCEGRDRSASNTTSDTAEAGLFQTSFNAATASPLLQTLFKQYSANPLGFVEIFKEGVHAKDSDLENFGTGDGEKFQKLSKASPAFAVEFAAVGLRNIRTHWGPIKRREAEIRNECDAMFRQIQKSVDGSNLFPAVQLG
jgi:peptidoglycan hydrolase-like protein with peptidoglycan-binding domain